MFYLWKWFTKFNKIYEDYKYINENLSIYDTIEKKIDYCIKSIDKYSKLIKYGEKNNDLKFWKIKLSNFKDWKSDDGIFITSAKTEKDAYEAFLKKIFNNDFEYIWDDTPENFIEDLDLDIEEISFAEGEVMTFVSTHSS